MTKEELIAAGEYLLNKTFKKDVFGLGSFDDVLSEEDSKIAANWVRDLDLWSISHGIIANRIADLWIINGDRVNLENIKYVVDLLREYDE